MIGVFSSLIAAASSSDVLGSSLKDRPTDYLDARRQTGSSMSRHALASGTRAVTLMRRAVPQMK